MGDSREFTSPLPSRKRIHPKDPFWNGKKKAFIIAVTSTFILLQSLFLGNLSYLNGALWKDGEKVHNLQILMVDYDQGVIGESLRTAYASLKADSFPTLAEHTATTYADAAAIEHAVFVGDYWGAIYAHAGASERLAAALTGGDAAASYNGSNAITYVLNGARYPTVTQGYIEANMETLVGVTRIVYNNMNGTSALQFVANDRAAALALFNPIVSSSIDIKPTKQGPRVIYNTVSIVFPIILQFFFLMAVNGIGGMFQLYSHLPLKNNGIIRFVLAMSYTLIGSLCTSGYIWAFKESWDLATGQFFLMWMTYWLYMHINFMVLDCATAFIPMSFVPFFMLTWIVLNITSTIMPFELSPAFYRWAYALPAHETYQVLVQIWSDGGYQRLYQSLPILFAWEVAMLPLAVIGLHYRCEAAAVAAQKAEQEKDALVATAKEETLSASSRSATSTTREGSVPSGVLPATFPPSRDPLPRGNGTMTRRESEQYFPNTPIPFQDTLSRVVSRV